MAIWALFAFSGQVEAQEPAGRRVLILEKIEIVGNSKTKRDVILDYLTFRPGDAITPEVIESNWQRLSQTNFFKHLDIFTRPGSEKGKIVVIVEVKERRWPYLQFRGGHSDLDGWYFVPLSFRLDNVFGRGSSWGIDFYLSDRTSKLSFNYFTPRLFDSSISLGVELHTGNRQYVHYIEGYEVLQDVGFGGLDLKFSGNRGLFKYLVFGFRSQTYAPGNTVKVTELDTTISVDLLPSEISDQVEPRRINAFSLGLQADLRDNSFYPLHGFWGALVGEKSDTEVGSEVNFDRVTLDARIYQKLTGYYVLALNIKGSYASEKTPFYQRYYLGGGNSLRGYAERRLTPVGYGTKLFLSHVEFRFPFSSRSDKLPSASGVLFFDMGGIWLPEQQPDPDDLFKSVGFGFRFKLPILGLTRIDFAFPVDKVDEKDFKLHLSLGHTF